MAGAGRSRSHVNSRFFHRGKGGEEARPTVRQDPDVVSSHRLHSGLQAKPSEGVSAKPLRRVSRSRECNVSEDAIEAKFGYTIFSGNEPRLGWLLNMSTSSVEDQNRNKQIFSCVNLYFVGQDGSSFKAQVKFLPYFYVRTKALKERVVEVYLRRRYGEHFAAVELVEKEDLDLKNHLSGLRRTYLKLSFNTVQDLMAVRNDLLPVALRNQAKLEAGEACDSLNYNLSGKPEEERKVQDYIDYLVELREYDVPYHIRFAVDCDVRCGQWYNVSVQESIVKLEKRMDLLQRAEIRVCAFDIETTKLPLKFPDAAYDIIMMISYMVDGQGYLIVNRECVAEEIDDIEYSPKPEYEGHFKVINVSDESELLRRWFNHMIDVKPGIYVTYNGDGFDWPFIEQRAKHHGLNMFNETGFLHDESQGECLSKFACHLDCFAWVKRDSYLPQGSQGLKSVTKVKLGYDPLEVNAEDMVRLAVEQPQAMASYSVSDALSTYYLYMTYVHPFIFSLATIIPMSPDEVLRKGSGTLCEMLLMVQAFEGNIICPNKHRTELEKIHKGHLLESETYIGGHVECLESGVFRSDLPTKFNLASVAFQRLIDNLDRDLKRVIEDGNVSLDSVMNFDDIKEQIRSKLECLRDAPAREELPLIYHLDVAAMYPNIILTNRLQPSSVVTDGICAACDFNSPEKTCLRKMEWVWRGEVFSATRSEYAHLKNQIESEWFPSADGSTQQSFHDLSRDLQQNKLKDRLKKYCQKVYKRVLDKPMVELRSANICMRENSFYVNTVRSFRDRRYEYKGLNKVWKRKLDDARACGDSLLIQEAQDMVVLYDSLQLAHKCILNSFYGYVMRKGSRWYSMEMAGVVTYTGAKIIQNARYLVEQIGKPLELDTDGIWCALPGCFPESFSFVLRSFKKLTFSYPCLILNVDVTLSNTNSQYQTMVDSVKRTYVTTHECSIEFEVDGPYKAMILPASKEEGVLIKKRYAVFNQDGTLAELKGFEVKRRGELKLIKIFQAEVFENFLNGESLQQCYAAVGAVADRWLDFLETRGADVADAELLDYISESSTMSRSLADYGETKSCATTTAKRLADFLGDTMVKDKGLSCRYVIACSPQGAPVSERAVPVAIFETEPEISRVYLRKWCKCASDVTIRSIIDWAYYRQRLSSAIQKIITIPAAMQKVRNPVPRVNHPDWLWKKVQEKDDKWRQRSIRDVLRSQQRTSFAGLVTKNSSPDIEDIVGGEELNNVEGLRPAVRIFQVCRQEDSPREDQHHGTRGQKLACENEPTLRESLKLLKHEARIVSPSRIHHYGGWLELKKRKWKQRQNERRRLRQCVEVEERHVLTTGEILKGELKKSGGVGAYFKNERTALIRSHWQVVQVATSAVPGEFLVWVIAGEQMFKVLLKVPRVFFVNTRGSSSGALIGPQVTRQLPHGHPCFNLVEVSVDEVQFCCVRDELRGHLADPDVEGVYETKMPLALHTVLQLGCVCVVDTRAHQISPTNGWSIGDLRMKTTAEYSYLQNPLTVFYLYHSISDSRGLYALHIQDRGTIHVIIVNPFSSREVNTSLLERHFYAQMKGVKSNCRRNVMKFRIDYVLSSTEAGSILQKTLHELREGMQRPTLGLLECSRKCDMLALIPALTDFPCIDVDTTARDGHYQALGWQTIEARTAMHKCSRAFDWLHQRLALSRYVQVPLGNFVGDTTIFSADIFYSRALRDHQQVLWTSNNGMPDLGGNSEEDYGYVEEVQQPVFALPGAYRSITVELKIHHLPVNALLKCSQICETEDDTLPVAELEGAGGFKSALEQISLDDTSCSRAFQTLGTMAQGWLVNATSSSNAFADNLLQHLYRWLCSPQSMLHDPALHRILHKVMQKVHVLLLMELRKLGATVVFSDFSRVVVNTGKHDLLSAQGYCKYLVKTLRSRDLFQWIELVPHRSWHSLLFMDQYNYGGLEVEIADQTSASLVQDEDVTYCPAVVSCWNIANHLCTEANEFFILIVTEFMYFPWKHWHQSLLATVMEADTLECDYLKEQISSYFTDKLLRMVREVQGKYSGEVFINSGKVHTAEPLKLMWANTSGDPALEFVKCTCAVLSLDERVQDDIQVLRKNLLRLVNAREFSETAIFHDPCQPFILPNVICSYCNDCRDLDLCRDPSLLKKDWKCRSNACDQSYDLGLIENALVQIVRQKEWAYQLQDLSCLKCRQVKACHVLEQCVCGGDFTCTEYAAEHRRRLLMFLEIGRHYNFEFLLECTMWILHVS